MTLCRKTRCKERWKGGNKWEISCRKNEQTSGFNVALSSFFGCFFSFMPSGFFWWGRPVCTCQPRSEDSVIKHTADCSARRTKVTGTDALAVISRTERESGQKRMHIMREDTHTHTHISKHTLNIRIKGQIVSTLGDQHYLLLLFTATSNNSISSAEVFVWNLPEDKSCFGHKYWTWFQATLRVFMMKISRIQYVRLKLRFIWPTLTKSPNPSLTVTQVLCFTLKKRWQGGMRRLFSCYSVLLVMYHTKISKDLFT